MKTIKEIRAKTELFFRNTLKLDEINKRNGTINCGRCFMRLDDYIRDGLAPDSVKAVGTQGALIFTHPNYALQAGGVLKILSSFTKDARLLQRCAPLQNHTYKLSLGNGEAIEIIDLTVAQEPASLEQLPLQRVDTSQGQDVLITTLKGLPRREKDGTAYGCIILTWPSKDAHMLNFFVTSKDELSEVFFIDAQVGSICDSVSTEALPDIYFLQSTPPEGFEIAIKKEPAELDTPKLEAAKLELSTLKPLNPYDVDSFSHPFYPKQFFTDTAQPFYSAQPFYAALYTAAPFYPTQSLVQSPLETNGDNRTEMRPVSNKRPSTAASDAEIKALLDLYYTNYSQLNGSQFYKKWCNQHGGTRCYGWVIGQLQDAGFIARKGSYGIRNPYTPPISSLAPIAPLALCAPESNINDSEQSTSTKKMRPT